jgi:transcriptional regulator with XRE-family HTH domain
MPRMTIESALGTKVRALRRRQHLTQAALARQLGISASYLNLIEHNRRGISGELLIKLAEILPVDLKALSTAEDGRTVAELLEVFGDPLFETLDVIANDVRELAATSPAAAQGVLRLYRAYRAARESAQSLAAKMLGDGGEVNDLHTSRFPSEEVGDLIQQHLNYFPELEHGAETLAREAHLETDTLFTDLASYLQRTKGIEVRIEQAGRMRSALRRYDPAKRILWLSEVLRRGSRNFQLAHHVGLLTQGEVLDRIAADALLTTGNRARCAASRSPTTSRAAC